MSRKFNPKKFKPFVSHLTRTSPGMYKGILNECFREKDFDIGQVKKEVLLKEFSDRRLSCEDNDNILTCIVNRKVIAQEYNRRVIGNKLGESTRKKYFRIEISPEIGEKAESIDRIGDFRTTHPLYLRSNHFEGESGNDCTLSINMDENSIKLDCKESLNQG